MNIHGYFSDKRDKQLSQQDKLVIYNKFLAKKNTYGRPSLTKRLYSFRYAVSVMLIFAFAFGSYYSLQPSIISELLLGRDSAQALNVAQIIHAQGLYTIQGADNRKVVGTSIHDGDVIGVEEGSFVEVKISESHIAKIPGPATFQVTYLGDNGNGIDEYRLKMLSSNYVAIESINAEDLLANEGSKQEHLVLVTDDGLVINDTKAKKSIKKSSGKTPIALNTQDSQTRFVVQKLEGKSLIDNTGSEELTVTHEQENTSKVLIPNKTVASLNVVVENPEVIQAVLANTIEELEDLVQTIQPIQDILSAGQAIGMIQSGLSNTGVIDTGNVSTGLVLDTNSSSNSPIQLSGISNDIVEEKESDVNDRLYKVQQQLNATLLMGYIEKLTVAYMSAESQKVITQKSNIMAALNVAYEAIDHNNPYIDTSTTDLVNSALHLKDLLNKEGSFGSATHNLDVLAKWIKVIYSYEVGKYEKNAEAVNFMLIDSDLGLSKKVGENFK